MTIKISLTDLHEHSEKMMRRELDVRVHGEGDHRILGIILAKSIKKMEEHPDLSANAAFTEMIAEEVGGDIKLAASLGIELGKKYSELLSHKHGARYYDLSVVSIDDGENKSKHAEAHALKDELTKILGKNRVTEGLRFEGVKAKAMDDQIEDTITKSRGMFGNRLI